MSEGESATVGCIELQLVKWCACGAMLSFVSVFMSAVRETRDPRCDERGWECVWRECGRIPRSGGILRVRRYCGPGPCGELRLSPSLVQSVQTALAAPVTSTSSR